MPDYAKLAQTAQRLIHKSGREIKIVRLDRTNEDDTKPWRGNSVPRETPDAIVDAIAVFVPVSSASDLGLVFDAEPEKRGDQVALLAALDAGKYNLTEFDEIIDTDGSRWSIENAQLLRPGNIGLIYAMEVKR